MTLCCMFFFFLGKKPLLISEFEEGSVITLLCEAPSRLHPLSSTLASWGMGTCSPTPALPSSPSDVLLHLLFLLLLFPAMIRFYFLRLSQLLINPVSFENLKLSMGIIQIPEVWNGREAVGKTLINLRWIASPHLILMDFSHPRNLISYTGYP